MKIRWHYPLALFINCPSPDALNLAGEFMHKGSAVRYGLPGDKPKSIQTPDKGEVFFSTVRAISFFIEDIKPASIQEAEFPQLLRLMVSVMNCVLRSIRNAGVVSTAKEINPLESEAEKLFRRWAVEVSDDGENWSRLHKEDPAKDFLWMLFPDDIGELESTLWPDIEESIQDDINPSPEQEFVVNCFEYLHQRNYRMAVVESVLCLDIVTSQFLNGYLASYKKIPPHRIKEFLRPQLGLSARISGLLDLCLHPDDIKKIEFNKVLATINWRNEIIHKSGHLPQSLPEANIREYISSVLQLVFLLSGERNQIETMPEMQGIGMELSKRTSAPFPNIRVVGKHKVIMEFNIFPIPADFPGPDKLEEIAQEAVKLLSKRDKRFKAEEHLYIRFYCFPKKLRAYWSKGVLTIKS